MAATPSVKITKHFTFKAGTKAFSNRYHFTGGSPSSGAHWDSLADAIVAAEKLIYSSRVTIVEAVYYDAGSDLPVGSKSYSQAGTMTPGGSDVITPGECVKVGVFTTDARSTKNHPVYLFSYWHSVYMVPGTSPDEVSPTQRSAFHNYQTAWISGFSDGAVNHKRAGPNGAVALDFLAPVPDYITHRDFPK